MKRPFLKMIYALFSFLGGAFIIWYLLAHEIPDRSSLKSRGVIDHGTLEMAKESRTNGIPTGYELTVNYAGRKGDLTVSGKVYSQYVSDGKFQPGTPVDVVYLPDDPSIAELPQMLDLWFYWPLGPGYQAILSPFLIGFGLIELKTIFKPGIRQQKSTA